jgi:hypothetical protein
MTVDTATARQRVAAGVAVLDALDPDWRRQMDPDHLDMGSGTYFPRSGLSLCGCVAAQWHAAQAQAGGKGTFDYGLELLAQQMFTGSDEATAWAVEHGLEAEVAEVSEYALLTRLWREAITGIPQAAEEVGV